MMNILQNIIFFLLIAFTFIVSFVMVAINPLSANVVYARHDADATCSGCSASY